jgi:hypothetical protein
MRLCLCCVINPICHAEPPVNLPSSGRGQPYKVSNLMQFFRRYVALAIVADEVLCCFRFQSYRNGFVVVVSGNRCSRNQRRELAWPDIKKRPRASVLTPLPSEHPRVVHKLAVVLKE